MRARPDTGWPFLLLSAILFFLVPAACTQTTPTPAPSPTPTPAVRLPGDDAAHPTPVEWWYYNGHLTATDGSKYGFHYVFFQVRDPQQQERYFHIGHLSVSDHQRRRYVTAQNAVPRFVEPRVWGFWASAGLWNMSGYSAEHMLSAMTEEYAFNLQLRAVKPPVLHNEVGYFDYPTVGRSFYYSRPRMVVQGTLVDHGQPKLVGGQAWFDHQWGDFQTARLQWDWLGLQLDDKSELMVYDVRYLDSNERVRLGTYIDEGGRAVALGPSDFQMRSLSTWQSPATKATYPVEWQVEVPKLGLSLYVEPVLRDAELDARQTTRTVYWEGGVQVKGTRQGKEVTGVGFLEMTGYASDGS